MLPDWGTPPILLDWVVVVVVIGLFDWIVIGLFDWIVIGLFDWVVIGLSDIDPGSSLSTITPASTRHSINASISSSKAVLEPVPSSRIFKRKASKNPLERGTPKF